MSSYIEGTTATDNAEPETATVDTNGEAGKEQALKVFLSFFKVKP